MPAILLKKIVKIWPVDPDLEKKELSTSKTYSPPGKHAGRAQ